MNTTYIEKNRERRDGHQITALLIFFLASTFYLYEYILQVAPSVMFKPMMSSFGVNAESIGILSAFYFYSYAPMQLPAGLLFDRYGPRKMITMALLICAIGSVFVAASDTMFAVCLGRFLIGAGSAFSFIGVIVLTSSWFSPAYFATLVGIAQLMSSIGASFGQMPLAKLVAVSSWRTSNYILAALGFILALLVWVIIRDDPSLSKAKKPVRSWRSEMKHIYVVCKRSYTWYTGIYAFTIWTPIIVFAALWGIQFLEIKYETDLMTAAALCSMVWLGIGIGSPLWGFLSDRFVNRRFFLGLCATTCLVSTLWILYAPTPSIASMYVILFFLGVGAGGQALSFAVVKDNNSLESVGTATGVNNLAVLLGGAIFQPIVGFILHDKQSWTLVDGVPVYTLAAYQKALIIMPLCYAISLLAVIFLIKESHPMNARYRKTLFLK